MSEPAVDAGENGGGILLRNSKRMIPTTKATAVLFEARRMSAAKGVRMMIPNGT